MLHTNRQRLVRRGLTLVEVVLVVGIILLISAMVVPNLMRQIKQDALPRSAGQLRSLLTLVGAHAAFDGLRYRLRFPLDDELAMVSDDRQPIIEREDDPVEAPDVFNPVKASWVIGETLLGEIWCAEVRLGRPTIEELRFLQTRAGEGIVDELEERFEAEDFDPRRPPLVFDPDGSSEWVVFVLTDAPRDAATDELEDYDRVELIAEGSTGLAWIQRPLYDEELDLFEEKNWPVVLRQDFLQSRVLTEDDVLELREVSARGTGVELKGRRMQVEP